MPSTTPISGLPYPNLGESADGPSAIGALATAIDPQLSRAQSRTGAQIAAIASPRVGQLVTNTDTGRVLFWNGTTWRPVGGLATGTINFSGVAITSTWTTLAYFLGLGFEEVQFSLACNNAGGIHCVAVSEATKAQGVVFGSGAGLFVPQTATDAISSQFQDTGGVQRTLNLRNIRLDNDGYLRFEVQAPTAGTTNTSHRINWKAR